MPFELFFRVFFLVFFVVFFLAVAMTVIRFVQNIGQWSKNNASPRLTVDALVITKRAEVRTHHHAGGNGHTGSSTSYYVTFQVESGDRMELPVRGSEYGLLAEGDRGRLSFQGTRYLGFERK